MKNLLCLFGLLIANVANAANIGYVDDQIKIWTHTGPSIEYKVKYQLTPGTRFEILQKNEETDFIEIKDDEGRISWMNAKYLTTKPTANLLLADARKEIASLKQKHAEVEQKLEKQLREIAPQVEKNKALQQRLATAESELEQARQKAQLYESGFDRDAYFTGAVIVLSGMFIGWLLSRLGGRKQNSGWS